MGLADKRTDADLLHACRAGDREAYAVFYRRYRELVLSYHVRQVRSADLAADLMAETFARGLVAVRRSTGGLPDVPGAWLFAIARNLLIDSARRGQVEVHARRELRLEPLVLDDDDIERIHEIASATDLVGRLAPLIPQAEWKILCSRIVAEESYADLAARLRCSEAVARKRVSRAKAHLRTALGGHNA